MMSENRYVINSQVTLVHFKIQMLQKNTAKWHEILLRRYFLALGKKISQLHIP